MENRESKIEAGKKYDHGKLRYDLIPFDSLEKLAEVYSYGASKYEDQNWRKGMSWSRCIGAMLRHTFIWIRGETIDEESGCHHLAMSAWYCLSLMNYEKTHPDMDDRVKDLVVEHAKDHRMVAAQRIDKDGPPKYNIKFDPDLELTPERMADMKASAKKFLEFLQERERVRQ